jgi:hypothetical protein
LSLDVVDDLEEALRLAYDNVVAEGRSDEQSQLRYEQDFRNAVGAAATHRVVVEDALSAINRQLAQFRLAAIASVDDVPRVTQEVDRKLAEHGDIATYSALSTAGTTFAELREVLPRLDSSDLLAALTKLRTTERHQTHTFYERVLTDGIRWIQEGNLDTCPLCEQAINAAQVISRAQQRLAEMADLVDRRAAVQDQRQMLRDRILQVREAANRARRAIEGLEPRNRHFLGAILEQIVQLLARLQQATTNSDAIDADALQAAIPFTRQDAPLFQALASAQARLDELLSSFGTGDTTFQQLLTARRVITGIAENWAQLARARRKAAATNTRIAVLRRLREGAEAARKEEVQLLFDELSKEINDLYTRLHEDEPLGQIRLEVRDAVQKSVNLRADFYEKISEDPRAFYSEAHLDTLGIAIFLTLRRWYQRQNSACDLLVLDDVMTSVDSAHAVRMAEILLSEFSQFQMLLTTHDRIWYEHLRDIQARCGVAQSFVNKIIHKWTIEEGPDLREPEDERRLIDHQIQEGSGHEIAVTAGRLLEHMLQELRFSLRLSVEAKRGELYEIGELWPAFYSEIRRNYSTLYTSGRKTFDALNLRWPLRNWVGAHWNTWATNVSRSTAIDFAVAVRDMFDLVFCDRCRRFIGPSSAPLGQLSCRCGNRIYPAAGKDAVPPTSREQLVQATKGALQGAALDTSYYFRTKQTERQREN